MIETGGVEEARGSDEVGGVASTVGPSDGAMTTEADPRGRAVAMLVDSLALRVDGGNTPVTQKE